MSDETMLIDFQAGTVTSSAFEMNTSMGRMCYQESKNTLYHIGGMNSEGDDFSLKLESANREWTQFKKNHSSVLNARQLELCNAPYVYFY